MNKALVLGAGGFIGGHLANYLNANGFWVRGVDLKHNPWQGLAVDDFMIGDLRDPAVVATAIDRDFDEVYQLAADMGGAGYIFTGEHDADIKHNSATINLNVAPRCVKMGVKKVFYSSSACIYPQYNQLDPDNPKTEEDSAYPANPDSEYGWEKLFSERLFISFSRNHGLNVRIARFHNVFGPYGSWRDGREKAPAAICRKVALAKDGNEVEVWGDGKQTRSFLFIDECLDAVRRFMDSDFSGPMNIGSEEMVTIDQLVDLVGEISGKKLTKKHIQGPTGVRGRSSDNKLIKQVLGWSPSMPLKKGLERTYSWIEEQVKMLEPDLGNRTG